MISEVPCDTEDWSNDTENLILLGINTFFKINLVRNNHFKF